MIFSFNFKVEPIHIYVHNEQSAGGLAQILSQINVSLEKIMATQAEAAAQLATIGTKLDKISGETTALVLKVRELQDLLAAAGNVSPELQAAIDALSSQADAVDALVDDVAPNPTPTPEPTP